MVALQAKSKYNDLSQSYKLYYVLGGGGFLSILSFGMYQSLFIAATMAVSTVVVYLIISRKPEFMSIVANENGISIDGNEFLWSECVAWAAVELPHATEIVIETTTIQQKFLYFYVIPTQDKVQGLLGYLSGNLVYQEEMPYKDMTHNYMRKFGLI
jgi:hypothetical protein